MKVVAKRIEVRFINHIGLILSPNREVLFVSSQSRGVKCQSEHRVILANFFWACFGIAAKPWAETHLSRADTAPSSMVPMHTRVRWRPFKTSWDVVWFAFGSLPRFSHVTSLLQTMMVTKQKHSEIWSLSHLLLCSLS